MLEKKFVTTLAGYASSADFRRIFEEDMNRLYLLAFLLTADERKAEQCFVSGLEDAISGNRVFKEWARSWAERVIIRNALRTVNPVRNNVATTVRTVFVRKEGSALGTAQEAITAILALKAFDRFVYVMSTLVHYSDQECGVLLGASIPQVLAARVRSLQEIGKVMESRDYTSSPTKSKETLDKLSDAAAGLYLTANLATSA